MRLASPYFLLLLIPLGIAAWFILRRSRHKALVFSTTGCLPDKQSSWRIRIAAITPFLYLVGLFFLIVALARPQSQLSRSLRRSDVIAIQMVVDVSGSMKALDLSTKTPRGWDYKTRLDVVKTAFKDFVEQRPADLIGLISFGGYATALCPLTLDHSALIHVLDGLEIPENEHDKRGNIVNPEELLTAIGDALATACARLKDSEAKSKIAVLLSDGESNTGAVKPMEAVEVAKDLDIKVYTIGVGSTGYAPVKIETPFGARFARQEVTLDEELLRTIANETGGMYFNVKDKEALGNALEQIDKLEKTEIEKTVYYQYDELFTRWLIPGLILIILGTSLNMICAQRIV